MLKNKRQELNIQLSPVIVNVSRFPLDISNVITGEYIYLMHTSTKCSWQWGAAIKRACWISVFHSIEV